MSVPPITIALLEDHPVVTIALRQLLNIGQFRVVGVHRTAAAFRIGLDEHERQTGEPVRIAIVDYHLGRDEPDGSSLIKALSRRYRDTRIIVYSALEKDVFKSLAIRNGAHGYIGKTVALDRIPSHILSVLRNRIVIDPPLRQAASPSIAPPPNDHSHKLTARELDVGLLLLQGMGTGEIARKLGKQPSTISTQARKLYDKLGIRTPQQFTLKRDEWLEILSRLQPDPAEAAGDRHAAINAP